MIFLEVCNAGVGGTDNTNFIRKNHVDFKTTGTGYQLFKYPDVQISINAIYSVPTSDKINLTPVIQGQIINASYIKKEVVMEQLILLTMRINQTLQLKMEYLGQVKI